METLQARQGLTEDLIKVRQVTHYQASWTEGERGHAGMFTVQLILDNGVAEYVLRPAADDIQALIELFDRSGSTTFDVERKVLMFGDLGA